MEKNIKQHIKKLLKLFKVKILKQDFGVIII